MRTAELVVVGGGPAGVAAACRAAEHGAAVILIDENPLDPASMLRNIPRWYGARGAARKLTADAVYRWLDARPGLQAAVDAGVEVLTQHSVWGGFADGTLGIFDGTATSQLRAEQVILATGTTDLHLAFPGWTLGGVLGGGGALQLLELYGHLDGGRRMVVLGAGNLGLAVTQRALVAGIDVAAIVEIGPTVTGDAVLAAALSDQGVALLTGHTIQAAYGRAEVERVTLLDVASGAQTELAADTVCVAIGRQPAVELPYLLGCALAFDHALGGAYVQHDRLMRTSRPGVVVAGDVTGAADATWLDPAHAEAAGRQAADTAARPRAQMGPVALEPAPVGDRYLTEWHRVADLSASDELIVCRCEEVTRGQIVAATSLVGVDQPDDIKRVTRAGMGVCQGRGCRPIVAGILAQMANQPLARLPLASYRPPIRPVPLLALASEAEPSA